MKLENLLKHDKSGFLQMLEATPKMYLECLEKAGEIEAPEAERILVSGMGGSAIPGQILCEILDDPRITINRSFKLPSWVGDDVLVICVSYSGNTWETLNVFTEALKRRCHVYCISSNGKMLEKCREKGIPFFKVPENLLPRASLPWLLTPIASLIEKSLGVNGLLKAIRETVPELERIVDEYSPSNGGGEAFKIAEKIRERLPIVYAYKPYTSTAYRFKTQVNENAKYPCHVCEVPESIHNEICTLYSNAGLDTIILAIRDPMMEADEKLMDIMLNVMEKFNPGIKLVNIVAHGSSRLGKALSTILRLDYASFYLALLLERDPSETAQIKRAKERLAEKFR